MNLHEGDVAVYWQSPAACALRLTDEHRYAAKHQASLRPLVVGRVVFDVIDVIDSNDIGHC
jgi:hypothetical protein